MPTLKVEIEFDSKLIKLTEEQDGERVPLGMDKTISFITGGLGDLYVQLLVPHDGVMMELHAKKSSMMKKGAIWDMLPTADGGLMVRIKGIFKVNAYSHVVERIQESKGPIYIAGIYAGDWPAAGGDIIDYNKAKQVSTLIAKLSN
ncbi:MAG: hypothetical protein RLY14_643 [Planctomycetota bacterium]